MWQLFYVRNDSVYIGLYRRDFEEICQAIAKELAAFGKTVDEKERDEIMLTETWRKEIRAFLKIARGIGIISASVHTDKKLIVIQTYNYLVIKRQFLIVHLISE